MSQLFKSTKPIDIIRGDEWDSKQGRHRASNHIEIVIPGGSLFEKLQGGMLHLGSGLLIVTKREGIFEPK